MNQNNQNRNIIKAAYFVSQIESAERRLRHWQEQFDILEPELGSLDGFKIDFEKLFPKLEPSSD